jgi:hypothetical protein
VIANIAILSTIQLVAQVRDKLLGSLQPYAPEQVKAAMLEIERIRQVTADLKDEDRLLHRVQHLRQIVAGADEVEAQLALTSSPDPNRARFDLLKPVNLVSLANRSTLIA